MFEIYCDILAQLLIMGLFAISLLIVAYYVGYYIIYKKNLNGKKEIKISRALFLIGFITYVYLVICLTLVIREPAYGGVNLQLFYSHKKFLRTMSPFWFWQILLNVIMLFPLGVFLPLVSKFFRKFYHTLPTVLVFTVLLEILQLETMRGSFDLDDIFNNFVGAFLGYCIVMIIIKIREKKATK